MATPTGHRGERQAHPQPQKPSRCLSNTPTTKSPRGERQTHSNKPSRRATNRLQKVKCRQTDSNKPSRRLSDTPTTTSPHGERHNHNHNNKKPSRRATQPRQALAPSDRPTAQQQPSRRATNPEEAVVAVVVGRPQ
ncbi:expressed unknown protein [Seminavis robusta]|uniref:Uncharacterized protein n=1 Tax=Seminavis robusta TaxID=568900 RepID=A0A9N8ENW0_9STRA|nr:expressed unknown protein [Seminavis robusta]|eukprot:Sro1552_g281840.1 n/a (136) ;mRNA; r:19057-19464